MLHRKFLSYPLLAALSLLFAVPTFAADTATETPTAQTQLTQLPTVNPPPTFIPSPPDLGSKSYILLDVDSGKVIAEKDADNRLPPASLTKLMTLYLTADALKTGQITMNDQVNVSKQAWQMQGSRMFIKAGDNVPVNLLIQGIVVVSGNDATVAMAEHIAGSEDAFVSLMNQRAQTFGMTNTNYTDATGMPHPNHYTTARDLSTLAQHIINDFPQYYSWYSEKWFTYNGIRQPNRNRLLWRNSFVDGMKTGHTDEAGYCLVSSAKKGDMRLLVVMLGANSDTARTNDSQALLNFGFRFYETHKLYSANSTITDVRVWQGKTKTVPVSLTNNLYVTIPAGSYKNLKAVTAMNSTIKAPITKGQQLGELKIMLDDKVVTQAPLVAQQDDLAGGIWTRFSDSVSLSLHNFFDKDKADEEQAS